PEGGGMAVVIGSADTVHGSAEIRTYEHVAALYALRFHGAAFPVDATHYHALGHALAAFFPAADMSVTVTPLGKVMNEAAGQTLEKLMNDAAGQTLEAPGAPSPTGKTWVWVAAVVAAIVVLGGVYALIFFQR